MDKIVIKVAGVEKDSIAEDLEIVQGDEVVSLNGKTPIDLIEYREFCSVENLELHIKRLNGVSEIIEIEKDFEDDLGIIFESSVFDGIRKCANNCIFCFVDQQPSGLRESLYIKDDDWRLSYLEGTYVTLTNMRNVDWKRLEELRVGPLYISVHSTDPDVRSFMLSNKRASLIKEDLKKLEALDIPFHAQIVLCPTINDSDKLKATLDDLGQLNNVLSIAIVPLGVTKFRKQELARVNKEICIETIKIVEDFNKKAEHPLAQCSDEFFLKAGVEIPKASYYNGFNQIEDGVGSIRLLYDDFKKRVKKIKTPKTKKVLNLLTSSVGETIFKPIKDKLNEIENIEFNTIKIKSVFWGEEITVTGLITAKDIISTLKDLNLTEVFLSSVMLRPMDFEFLDGIKVHELEKELGVKVNIIRDNYSTKEIIEYFNF